MKEKVKQNKMIVSVLVDNSSCVAAEITNVFEEQGAVLLSLAVGIAEKNCVARVTAVVSCDETVLSASVARLSTLSCVHNVKILGDTDSVTRELVLIKVAADSDTRSEIIEIVNVFRGKIIDMAPSSVVIEVTGEDDKTEALINMLNKFGVIETARTGIVALDRGTANIYE